MIRRHKLSRLALPLALVLGLTLAAPALADSVATEQAQGAQILSQVQHGSLSAKALTSDQYQKLGEYLMGRALGSPQLHQRINTLMDEMMGSSASDQMHIYLAKRFLGVRIAPSSRYRQLHGLMGAMMSGYRGSALAGMMGAYLNGQGTAGYGAQLLRHSSPAGLAGHSRNSISDVLKHGHCSYYIVYPHRVSGGTRESNQVPMERIRDDPRVAWRIRTDLVHALASSEGWHLSARSKSSPLSPSASAYGRAAARARPSQRSAPPRAR